MARVSMSFWPPSKPDIAKDPQVRALGHELMDGVLKFYRQWPSCLKPGFKDPWMRNEAWRYTEEFQLRTQLKKAFPGLGIALVAFGVYLGLEQAGVLGEKEH